MAPKMGRKDPCWWVRQEIQRCQLGRVGQDAVRPWEVHAHFRKLAEKGQCRHRGATRGSICGGHAIDSHTVPQKMPR